MIIKIHFSTNIDLIKITEFKNHQHKRGLQRYRSREFHFIKITYIITKAGVILIYHQKE